MAEKLRERVGNYDFKCAWQEIVTRAANRAAQEARELGAQSTQGRLKQTSNRLPIGR